MNYFCGFGRIIFFLAILCCGFIAANAQDTTKETQKEANDDNWRNNGCSTRRNEIGFYSGVSTIHKDLSDPPAGQNFGLLAFCYSQAIQDRRSLVISNIICQTFIREI